ncbi:MAG: hypothetical protein JW881_05975 [Spirochaetales bacterium]|nr:hypothetical protein [Spirochaetales bacterium]
MKKCILAVLLAAVLCSTCIETQIKKDTGNDSGVTENLSGWEKIAQLREKGLMASILKELDVLYTKAKKEKDELELIKILIYRLPYELFSSDYAYKEIIENLEREIGEIKEPAASILKSILAEYYFSYFRRFSYQFSYRTETFGIEEDDIETWNAAAFGNKITGLYLDSLENEKLLEKKKMDAFSDILEEGNSRDIRPTLYDFLAYRALDFFTSGMVFSFTPPAGTFAFDDPRLFGSPKEFLSLKIPIEDTSPITLHALRLLQKLTAFHLKDKKPEALIHLDLKRLDFVRTQAAGPDKDKHYESALEKLESAYRKHPSYGLVSYRLARLYREKGSRYRPAVSDEHRMDIKKAYEICESVIERFPGTEGAADCLALRSSILEKSLDFSIEKANLPEKPFRALLRFKNIEKVYFRAVPLESPMRETIGEIRRTEGYDAAFDSYLTLPARKAWAVDIPDTGDFQPHKAETAIPGLAKGYYVILASANEDFSTAGNAISYSPVWITEISFLKCDEWTEGNGRYYAAHRETGRPLAGITVDIIEPKWNSMTQKYTRTQAERYTTDKNGLFSVKKGFERDYLISFTSKDDALLFDDEFYQYPPPDYEENPLATYFITDRSIYRPGQTIYFKGIVIRHLENGGDRLKTEARHKTIVVFHDVNSKEISKLNLETNEYGSFSGSFVAPIDRLTGSMSITNESGSVTLSVEEYKRPGFEVSMAPPQGSVTLGKEVTVTGTARAFSGYGIADAAVRFRVVRNASYPYRWWGYRGYYHPSPETEIRHGTATTDIAGTFTIGFTAAPDPSVPEEELPVFSYTVYADVTDTTGETHSNSITVRSGYVSLDLSIDVPEHLEREQPREFPIKSRNLDGVFIPASGTVAITRLAPPGREFRERLWERPDIFLMDRESFYAAFPNDVYDDENEPRTWKREERVYSGKFDTAKHRSLELENISGWKGGMYLLEMASADTSGRKITVERYFTLSSGKAAPLPVPETLRIRPVTETCRPGDDIEFEIGTTETGVSVTYEISHKARIVEHKALVIDNETRTVRFPVKEDHRGMLNVHVIGIRHNRAYTVNYPVFVDWDNDDIGIEFETFRDTLLPGAKEEWRLKLSGPKGEAAAAEMAATLYDASLDSFLPHAWPNTFLPQLYAAKYWEGDVSFAPLSSRTVEWNWNIYEEGYNRTYDRLKFLDESMSASFQYAVARSSISMVPEVADTFLKEESEALPPSPGISTDKTADGRDGAPRKDTGTGPGTPFADIDIRTNLNETAFFFPHLKTDKDGRIVIAFTMPEALTRWKMIGFAHTKTMSYGYIEKETVTKKDLMISPNAPRFFREGDRIAFAAKVTNLSEKKLSGKAALMLFDAFSMKPVDAVFKNTNASVPFTVDKEQSVPVSWDIEIPESIQAVTYRLTARAGDFTDGEESTLPVLPNRMLVTEALPLPIKGKQTKTFGFEKLAASGASKTLRHHRLTLEFTSNPAWYAVQALPYLMEFPHECAEQIASRYYANSLAAHIIGLNPKIKKVFDAWGDGGSNISNLEKNEDLKSLLLRETPWVLQAQDETERKKRVALLFDINRLARENGIAFGKLMDMQAPNGGWPWFSGLPEDRYITQHIVALTGHLDKLGVKSARVDDRVRNTIARALDFLDKAMQTDYDRLKKSGTDPEKHHPGYLMIHYLYARSFFPDAAVEEHRREAFDYWKTQAGRYWNEYGPYLKAMTGLALYRFGEKTIPEAIIRSLKESAIVSEETGMYWSVPPGYYWYQARIETQALLIEAFSDIAGDREAVDEMQVWLLKQKQTQDWKTTKATAEACYALLMQGSDLLSDNEAVGITLGTTTIDPRAMEAAKPEAGTGYFRTSWGPGEIKPDMGKVTVEKKTGGVAWGALYWQYFEELDKITPYKTPLGLEKTLTLTVDTEKGRILKPVKKTTVLSTGDLLTVRIVLRVDRDMEYVHMKDMRAAALEPVNANSGYRYRDGLWYYESIKDATVDFFFPRLVRGTYVFEYPLRITQRGNFANGITTIQCMYAPEFTSHSEGVRIGVE